MFHRTMICLRSFVRSLVLLNVLSAAALLAPNAARPALAQSPGVPDASAADTTGIALPLLERGEKVLEKVYEVGKAWYEAYEAFEEERNDVSLKTPFRLEITPETMKVTENARNRLPNVEVKAGVAWVPYKGQTTTVNWEFQVGGGKGGGGSMSNTGRPSEDEWEDWYDPKPYPYTGAGFDNDHIRYEFDVVAPGEAFNEGINTVKVKLWGTTKVEVNYWNPLNWLGSPTESKDFNEVISQERDVTVEVPYAIRKDPNLDVVEQNHQANLTVQLWDKNLARESLGGNIQNYYEPKVRVQCTDGTVPPDDGTSNSEKMVCSDTRIHTGEHPPERVHVTPDFDPISIIVKHIVWDLPENATRVYERSKVLRKTELYCLQPGVPTTPTPTPTPDPNPVPTPDGSKPFRNARTPSPALDDPDCGFQPIVEQGVLWEIISLQYGTPTISRVIDTHQPDHWIPLALAAGDLVEYRYTLRDQFGRTFHTSQVLTVPPADDLSAPDDIMAAPPVLLLAEREQMPDPMLPVEVRVMDLAGLSFGELRTAAQVMVADGMSGQVQMSDAEGMCLLQIAHGQRMQLQVQDPQGRYLPVQLPPSPPVLRSLTVHDTPEPPGLIDDRVYLWMSPSFETGHLAPGAGRITVGPDGVEVRIGAVSDLSPERVAQAEWLFVTDEPIFPAVVQEWGATDRRGLGYVPARFAIPGEGLPPSALDRLSNDRVIRLRVQTVDLETIVIDLPLTVEGDVQHVPDTQFAATGLWAPQPNPAANAATIRFDLAQSAAVRLGVYDVQGRLIRTLFDGEKTAGSHEATWNTRDESGRAVSSGVYFFRMETGGRMETQRLMLVR